MTTQQDQLRELGWRRVGAQGGCVLIEVVPAVDGWREASIVAVPRADVGAYLERAVASKRTHKNRALCASGAPRTRGRL